MNEVSIVVYLMQEALKSLCDQLQKEEGGNTEIDLITLKSVISISDFSCGYTEQLFRGQTSPFLQLEGGQILIRPPTYPSCNW